MTRIIGISSGKGGVGKTIVSANLAVALSNLGRKIIVVDCNISTPHLTYYLGAYKYDITINDVLRGKKPITAALYHHNGVMFIPASLALEDLVTLDVVKLKRHVKKLVNPDMIDFVLLDSAPGIGREALSVMDAASEILFVTHPSYPVIRDAIRCADVVKELGEKRMGIILNMVNFHRSELSVGDIGVLTKLPVVGSIRYDKNIINSLAVRKPVLKYKPFSRASIDFMKLAANIIGEEYNPPKALALRRFYERIRSAINPSRPSDLFEEKF